jgi:hypothetical protein
MPSGPRPRIGREDMVLRTEHDPSTAMFAQVDGLTNAMDGRVIVADSKQRLVQVFSATGQHQFDVTKAGGFIGPCCVAVGRDSTLWVLEREARQYIVFRLGPDHAEVIRIIPLPVAASGVQRRVLWDDHGRPMVLSDASGTAGETITVQTSLDYSGRIVRQDTLTSPESDHNRYVLLKADGGRRMTGIAQPFGPTFLQAHGPRGELATAIATNYDINVADGIGSHHVTRSEPAPVMVSRRERRRAEASLTRLARNMGLSRRAIPFAVPDRKAPLEELHFDADGRLWAIRATEERSVRQADLYGQGGALVSSLAWPRTVLLEPATAAANAAFGVDLSSRAPRVVRLVF